MLKISTSCALVALALVACSSSSSTNGANNTGTELLPIPPASEGLQLRMATTLDAGEEDERCQFVVAPPEGLYIKKEEVRYKAGSHHILLWTTPYTSIPTKDEHGTALDTKGVFKCSSGVLADWKATSIIGGAQSADGAPIVDNLPEGVALKVPGGAIMIMDGHFLNAQATSRDTEVLINLWTVPKEKVTTEAGVYLLYNPYIRVPARGEADARMSCPVPADITLVNGQSHMHKRGVGQTATLNVSVKELSGEAIDESAEWENVPVRDYKAKAVKAGSAIDFRCHYKNTEDRVITQGLTTKDEMCAFLGLYYPKNEAFENCSVDGKPENISTAATYIGSGKTSCAESLACIGKSKPMTDDKGESLFGCVVESCPKAANQLTDALKCQASLGGGACAEQCKSTDKEACGACLQTACKAPVDACVAAACN